jgi:hypothetical protein
MADKYFDDFVNKQLELANTSPSIDWTAMRDDWLKHLDEFYDSVRQFLGDYIDKDKIRVKCTPKQISEEHIGSSEAQSLEVQIGPARIGFDPVGTNLIGARGRVDMHGPYGSVKFVFVPKQNPQNRISIQDAPLEEHRRVDMSGEEWAWKISTPPPSIRYIELEEESFLSAIMEVASAS